MDGMIDIKQIFTTIKQNKWWLIGAICLSIGLMSAYLWFIATPIYQSSTQILISQTEEKEAAIQSQTVQASLDLIDTYNVIIKSPRILKEVGKQLGDKYSQDELSQAIQVSSASNSQIIDIKVNNPSPQVAVDIANITASVFQAEIVTIMKVNNVTILSTATREQNSKPIAPKKTLFLLLSFFLGTVIGMLIILLKIYSDRTIKNKEDIARYFDINILGTVNEINLNKHGKGK